MTDGGGLLSLHVNVEISLTDGDWSSQQGQAQDFVNGYSKLQKNLKHEGV
jgi:hypothetical protein